MNVATLLIHSSLFLIGFILLGLLARWLYHRNVVTPHNRQINALVNDFIRLWRDHSDLGKDNLRLKRNMNYLGDRFERAWAKLMTARATCESLQRENCSLTNERDNLAKDLEAALHRIDELETRNNHYLTKILAHERKNRKRS